MPGFLVHIGATVMCSHGAPAQPTSVIPRVLVSGQPIVTMPIPYVISGCPQAGVPAPFCATGQWTMTATRIFAQRWLLAPCAWSESPEAGHSVLHRPVEPTRPNEDTPARYSCAYHPPPPPPPPPPPEKPPPPEPDELELCGSALDTPELMLEISASLRPESECPPPVEKPAQPGL